MNRFEINEKQYTALPFDFNLVCDLEDYGISILSGDIRKKPAALLRAYFAMHLGGDSAEAGKELEAHMISGGTLKGMTKAMNAEMEKSDFFRSLIKGETEEVPENQEETKALPGEVEDQK